MLVVKAGLRLTFAAEVVEAGFLTVDGFSTVAFEFSLLDFTIGFALLN
jgi:hypothetical protein